MANFKMDRLSEDIMREITDIIRTLKDPRVSESLLSVVRCDVSKDLSYATVYVSAISGLDAAKRAVVGLKSASGYVRRELSSRIELRHTPELRFVADDSIEHSADIARMLEDLSKD